MEKSLLKETGRLHNLVCRRVRFGGKEGQRGMKLRGLVMGYLDRNEGRDVFQRDIERELDVRSSTVTVVLNRMESEGVIERTSMASDRRLKKITLTDKAKRVTKKWNGFVSELETDLLKGITDDELETFYKVLDTICLNLEDIK